MFVDRAPAPRAARPPSGLVRGLQLTRQPAGPSWTPSPARPPPQQLGAASAVRLPVARSFAPFSPFFHRRGARQPHHLSSAGSPPSGVAAPGLARRLPTMPAPADGGAHFGIGYAHPGFAVSLLIILSVIPPPSPKAQLANPLLAITRTLRITVSSDRWSDAQTGSAN